MKQRMQHAPVHSIRVWRRVTWCSYFENTFVGRTKADAGCWEWSLANAVPGPMSGHCVTDCYLAPESVLGYYSLEQNKKQQRNQNLKQKCNKLLTVMMYILTYSFLSYMHYVHKCTYWIRVCNKDFQFRCYIFHWQCRKLGPILKVYHRALNNFHKPLGFKLILWKPYRWSALRLFQQLQTMA